MGKIPPWQNSGADDPFHEFWDNPTGATPSVTSQRTLELEEGNGHLLLENGDSLILEDA